MSDHRQPTCDRTRRLIDRVVDDKVTPDDRAHAATCASCGPLIARASRFDDDLGRSTRRLVTEQLPHGLLEPELAPARIGGVLPVRHAAPGLTSIFAAVVILMIATAVVVAPDGGLGQGTAPPDSGFQVSSPTFRSTADIASSVKALDYSCIPGHAFPTSAPSARLGEREGVRCLTPKTIERAKATIIPIESDGQTVEVIVEGALYGPDAVASRSELATTMGKLTFISIADPMAAADAGEFVEAMLPGLLDALPSDHVEKTFGSVKVLLSHSASGEYLLTLSLAGP